VFLASRLDNECVGLIATKTRKGLALLLFNYIDPEIAKNYLSRHLSELSAKQARALVNLVNSSKWEQIINKSISLKSLRLNKKIRARLKEAIALHDKAVSLMQNPQGVNLKLVNLKSNYTYKKYVVDKSCCLDCAFVPREEKEIGGVDTYTETLFLEPFSVVLILLEQNTAAVSELIEESTETFTTDEDKQEAERDDVAGH